ncbi:hypothetical protein L596_012968 [Steinernema carpocapsae]|uniref:Uncharacterized protein n=1 Tax=Steinernema carpocapsae TaxID=34508 RepID=A0A4U5NYN9_STECR|nr:hypothetical protein L596_012968 [Steinernema carpocapsae]
MQDKTNWQIVRLKPFSDKAKKGVLQVVELSRRDYHAQTTIGYDENEGSSVRNSEKVVKFSFFPYSNFAILRNPKAVSCHSDARIVISAFKNSLPQN